MVINISRKLLSSLALFAAIIIFMQDVSAKQVKYIEIDGVIHPASSRFIQRAIDEANDSEAEALLIQLDTPGGLMESMRDIIKSILASDVPVIVYVSPSGSRAGSAGVFITLSAHVAAMAPGTNIGAAHPVSLGMGQEDDTTGVMEEKVLNDAVAFIRSIAEKQGRNADWAESAVRESASITETEALELGVIDVIAPSVDSLLVMLDGREVALPLGNRKLELTGVVLEEISRTWRDQFLEVISDPNIAYVLMMLGMYGLFFELYNPGTVVPGVIGGICLILAFFAFQTLPINVAGLLLIVLAIILFLLEIKVVSYGVLAIGGTISLILGSVMLIESPIPGVEISWGVILPGVIGTVLFFLVAISLSIKAQKRRPTTGLEGMIEETGEVIEKLDPVGKVKVRGEIWNAKSTVGKLPKGSQIRVQKAERNLLIVEEFKE
ncbi:serine protease [candidate division LCP-89 bacterium B3_LCP]|uniref:Serine protease n=1 Tax=candidate division LCP-89 bacterium B3_LCP TaxID=2012998 RepID=A0A532UY54_UNCL8|nr:MAG: serine protease [candidate division LCP-89 bacterium B3_LCP]